MISENYTVTYKLCDKSLNKLKNKGLPDNILVKLNKLSEIEFKGEVEFIDYINQTIGNENAEIYKSIILDYSKNNLETIVGSFLNNLGLLSFARYVRHLINSIINYKIRKLMIYRVKRFIKFALMYRGILHRNFYPKTLNNKKALIIGFGYPEIEAELGLIKAIELAGYLPVILLFSDTK